MIKEPLPEEARPLLHSPHVASLTIYDFDGAVVHEQLIWFDWDGRRLRTLVDLALMPRGCSASFCLETEGGAVCLLGQPTLDRDPRVLSETKARLAARYQAPIKGRPQATLWVEPEVFHHEIPAA